MTVELILSYLRVAGSDLSSGHIGSRDGGLQTEEGSFQNYTFDAMILTLSNAMKHWPEDVPIDVIFQRVDRDGLLPVTLDVATVHLIRTDPAAAVAALSLKDASPSSVVKRVVENRTPIVIPPLPVGDDVLADTFGDQLYFKVRGHELECPCCGFWGAFAAPGLLNHPDREGTSFKTVFACPKRCGCRTQVTCNKTWGYVSTEHLLADTACNAFYFPRAWNGGRPWVTRDALHLMYRQYLEEKERALCSKQQTPDPQV